MEIAEGVLYIQTYVRMETGNLMQAGLRDGKSYHHDLRKNGFRFHVRQVVQSVSMCMELPRSLLMPRGLCAHTYFYLLLA